MVDSSGSIRRERFPYVLDFIARFVNETEVDMEKTRIGCVQFSRDSSTAFYLDVSVTLGGWGGVIRGQGV